MIITFSGTDGVGKSTQIKWIQKYLENKSIDYRIQYVRGGHTKIVKMYKQFISLANRKNPSSLLVTIGLSIALLELMCIWGIWLRWQNKLHSIVLCDRYIWDTYVDFIQRFQLYRIRAWWFLELITPKPDIAILYMASETTILNRLREKEPYSTNNANHTQSALEIYSNIQDEFEYVLDAEKDVEVLFKSTLCCMPII